MVILFMIYVVMFLAGCTIPIRFITVLLNSLKPLRPKNVIIKVLLFVSDIGGVLCLPVAYIYIYYPNKESIFNEGWTFFWVACIIACIAAYFVASYQLTVLPLLQEFFLNLALGLGLAASLSIGYELAVGLKSVFQSFTFTSPVIFLFLIALTKRHLIIFNRLPPESNFLRFWRSDKSEVRDHVFCGSKKRNAWEEMVVWGLTKPLLIHLFLFILGGFIIIGAFVLTGRLLDY